MNAKVPGTSFKFKCSPGFALADKTNPDQIISCTATIQVRGLDTAKKCEALECSVPTVDIVTTKTDYDFGDVLSNLVNKTYTLECLEGYAMVAQSGVAFSDKALCTLDTTVPSVKWVYNNNQDQPTDCKGNDYSIVLT